MVFITSCKAYRDTLALENLTARPVKFARLMTESGMKKF